MIMIVCTTVESRDEDDEDGGREESKNKIEIGPDLIDPSPAWTCFNPFSLAQVIQKKKVF